MADENSETQTLMLMVLLALWLAAWAYSVVLLLSAWQAGPGPNRMIGFFGWQGVAGILAFTCWGVGASFAKGSGIRQVSAVPLAMAFTLALVVTGMTLFGGGA